MKNSTIFLVFSIGLLISCRNEVSNTEDNLYKAAQTHNLNTEKVDSKNVIQPFSAATPKTTPMSTPIDKLNLRIGVIDYNVIEESHRLTTSNANLKKGDKFRIISTPEPNEVIETEISEQFELNRSRVENMGKDLDNFTVYKFNMPKQYESKIIYGIAILDPKIELRESKGKVSFDIDNDGRQEQIRGCRSMEGIHLTIWKGKPLASKRIWNSYVTLGYETVPNCKEKDYKELE